VNLSERCKTLGNIRYYKTQSRKKEVWRRNESPTYKRGIGSTQENSRTL
jgi:hypothetical protein